MRAFRLTSLATLVLALLAHASAAAQDDATARVEAARLNTEGLALYETGAYADAIERFTRARDLLPGEAVLTTNLANASAAYGVQLAEAGETHAAITHLRRARELDPANRAGGVALTNLYVERGEYAKARTVLHDYITRFPDDPDARVLLGELAYRTGDLSGALGAWRDVQTVRPGDEDLAQRIAKTERELEVEGDFAGDRDAHFTVRYAGDRLEDAGYHVLRFCRDARREIGRDLHVYPRNPVEVILYTTAQFDAVTQQQSHVAGLYDGKIRIRLPAGPMDIPYLRRVVYHEYGHLVVGELTNNNCPYWLNEGLAQWLSEEFTERHRAQLRRTTLPTVGSLEEVDLGGTSADRLLLLNATSFALVQYLRERYSSRYLLNLLEALGNGAAPQAALRATYRRSYAYLDEALEDYLEP